jgi:hypothetical protein
MDNTFKSQFHDIVLKLTGWDEPHNGRLLHNADLKINGKLENIKYFGNWNWLDQRLDKLTLDAPNKRYVYIPAESGGFLIDTTNFNKIQLPYKSFICYNSDYKLKFGYNTCKFIFYMKTHEEVKQELDRLLIMINNASYQRLDGDAIYAKIVALQWVIGETADIFEASKQYRIIK